MAKLTVLSEVAQMQRRTRSPAHPFNLSYRPWQIQPFFIAPVLPGETMQEVTVQARTVTDPIQNGLIGCSNHQPISGCTSGLETTRDCRTRFFSVSPGRTGASMKG